MVKNVSGFVYAPTSVSSISLPLRVDDAFFFSNIEKECLRSYPTAECSFVCLYTSCCELRKKKGRSSISVCYFSCLFFFGLISVNKFTGVMHREIPWVFGTLSLRHRGKRPAPTT